MFRIFSILIGYLIGCLQTAYFVGKVMQVDIRKRGSGNLGSTNVLRVLGKRAGAVTFFCDLLKSVAAFIVCIFLFRDNPMVVGLYAGAGVVLGHDFPFYLGFKGGKGIAAMIGLFLCIATIDPKVTGFTFLFGIVGLLTRYVSVGSLLFSVSIPVSLYIFHYSPEVVFIGLFLAVLACIRHKENIKRLIHGNENRLGAKKPTNGMGRV